MFETEVISPPKPVGNETKPPRSQLNITHLTKRFASPGREVIAVENVDLKINRGEFICLIGASGCGKSTLLRIIAGFEKATTGSVEVFGHAITDPGPDRGMVFQDYGLFPWLSTRDNIAFGPRHAGRPRPEIEETTAKFMEMVGLTSFADSYPHQLSGGMKQRVAIARVLANDTDILLMDEPFGALDALTRAKLQEELLDLWKRTRLTVIFVTHSVEEALVLADRVLVMGAGPGRIVADFSVDIERPRDVSSPAFNEIRREVTGRMTNNLSPTRNSSNGDAS